MGGYSAVLVVMMLFKDWKRVLEMCRSGDVLVAWSAQYRVRCKQAVSARLLTFGML
jgi:hypothetical protein